MSFSVVAGGHQDQNSNLSPYAAAFMSKSTGGSAPNSANAGVRSAGSGMPPPFSLSAAGNMGTPGGTLAHPPDDALFQNQKRIGTDPSKFKTTICRNWEQTGICSFRGCTFAHGVDDLRPPMRPAPSTQNLGATNATGAKKSPSTSPNLQASAAHNGGSTTTTRLDRLIEMLAHEVAKDKDLVLVHQEAYRTLEAMLRREHTLYDDAYNKLEGTKLKVGLFIKKLREKDAALQRTIATAKASEVSGEMRRVAMSMNQSMETAIAQAQGETQAILADQEEAIGAEGRRQVAGPSSFGIQGNSGNEGTSWGGHSGMHQQQQQQNNQQMPNGQFNSGSQTARTDSSRTGGSTTPPPKQSAGGSSGGLSYAAAATGKKVVKPPVSIGLQPIDALGSDDDY